MASCAVTGSPSAITAAALPRNGAVEKYAPVRAVPRCRIAMMNSARLTPYPKKPTIPEMMMAEMLGMAAPIERPRTRLNGPAISPFSSTICSGSASETLRVRLLSRPHARHAPTIASGPTRGLYRWRAGPGKDDRPSHETRHAERDATVEILMENEPCHEGGCRTFKREEKRGGGGIGACKTNHQEQRADHATDCNRTSEPRKV